MSCSHPLCNVLLEDDDQSVNTTDERISRNRKRKPSSRDKILEWEPVEYVPPSIRMERSVPMRPRKKVRLTSSIISPPPLSTVDLTDVRPEDESDAPLLPVTEDLTTVDLGDVESEYDPNDLG